ncbi:MAG: DUF2865 domain-containing protein [Rhizobiaceae bacterium]|nr:DUF2865 domain-containing protein [Rhizobiaceae bacterium]
MRRISTGIGLLVTAGLLATVIAGPPAFADRSQCSDLEAQLASVSQGSSRANIRRYERAIISQKQQLERAMNRQQNAGCSTFFSAVKPHCSDIRSTVSRMERNLLSLQRTRNELSGGNASAETARIQAALNANGCRGTTTASNEDQRQPVTLFGRLFGARESERRPTREPEGAEEQTSAGRIPTRPRTPAPGNYRTLCVRTCDGYFFPIAYSSSPGLFDRDFKACQAMCPGTEVELYHHRVPDEETDAMISSVSGEPYTDLASAFLYRDPDYQRASSCQCNPPKDFSVIAGDLPKQSEAEEEGANRQAVILPEPLSRPDPAEDPEARANREGGLTPAAIAELLAPTTTVKTASAVPEEPAAERRVRVVGPAFLPDPEAAIDLRAPGRTELR